MLSYTPCSVNKITETCYSRHESIQDGERTEINRNCLLEKIYVVAWGIGAFSIAQILGGTTPSL